VIGQDGDDGWMGGWVEVTRMWQVELTLPDPRYLPSSTYLTLFVTYPRATLICKVPTLRITKLRIKVGTYLTNRVPFLRKHGKATRKVKVASSGLPFLAYRTSRYQQLKEGNRSTRPPGHQATRPPGPLCGF
jgi:hypothetical protein